MLKSRFFYILVAIVLTLLGFYAEQVNDQNHKQAERQKVLNRLGEIRASLETNIHANLQTARGLVGLISNEPYLTQERFSQYASPLLDNNTQLRNVAAAPGLVIRYVYPYETNKGAIGLDFNQNKHQKAEALLARDSGNMILAGPINLVQGGIGLIGRIPVFLNDSETDRRLFWGLISAVIDLKSLYSASGLNSESLDIEIAILKSDSPQSLFYGQAGTLQKDPVMTHVTIPGGQWVLAAVPVKGWLAEVPNRWIIRITFIVLITLLFLLMVTMEKSARRLLLEKERLKSLFELSPVGIALNDFETGNFIEVNDAIVAPSGYSKEEFIGLSYWDLTPKKYEKEEAAQLESLKRFGRYGPYEKEYINKNGDCYPVLLNGVLIKDLKGQGYIWSIIEDITQRKDNEKRLRDSVKTAEAAARAKTEFLATMSHEIRTPMNGVLGMINLLAKSQLDEEQKRKLGIAKSSAKFLLNVINDILDFSRIESGELKLEQVNFDLETLFKEVIDNFAMQAKEKNLHLELLPGQVTTPQLKGDPFRIRQILFNLIGNAFKFTQEGTITIHYSLLNKNDKLQLDVGVKDTGIGIQKEKQEGLFDAFTQVDASTTRKYGGSGLGLAICAKLCKLMAGKISVESEEKVGSHFRFSLILEQADQQVNQVEVIDSSEQLLAPTPDANILIVEDNSFNREVVKMVLQELGFNCDLAENGLEALSLLTKNEYQLILMDCQMPVMDGYQTTQNIRNGKAGAIHKDIPIIALTANAMEGDKEKCLAAGMNDYTTKPIEPDVLHPKMLYWLNQFKNINNQQSIKVEG